VQGATYGPLSGETADFLGDDAGVASDGESCERHRYEREDEAKECPVVPPPEGTDEWAVAGYGVITAAK